MKQLLFSGLFLLFSLSVFGQATPVGELRVADATSQFKTAIPAGTKIYNMATSKYWVSVNGAAAGVSLGTPGAATFVLLNPNEQTVSAVGGSIKLTKTAADGTAATTSDIAITAGGINVISTPDAGTIKITATEEQVLDYTADPTNGTVTISGGSGSSDNVILPLATGTNAGLLKPEDFTKLSNIDPTAIVGTYVVYQKEADAALVGPGVGAGIVTLSPVPKTTSTASSVLVSYNGVELNNSAAAGLYSVNIAAGTVTFDLAKVPISLYDLITVSYLKK